MDGSRIHKEKFAFSNENHTCGQGLNKQNNNARTDQTFLYISLTSLHECDVKFSQVTFYDVDVTFFITPILRYPPKTIFLNVPETYLPKCNARFNKK